MISRIGLRSLLLLGFCLCLLGQANLGWSSHYAISYSSAVPNGGSAPAEVVCNPASLPQWTKSFSNFLTGWGFAGYCTTTPDGLAQCAGTIAGKSTITVTFTWSLDPGETVLQPTPSVVIARIDSTCIATASSPTYSGSVDDGFGQTDSFSGTKTSATAAGSMWYPIKDPGTYFTESVTVSATATAGSGQAAITRRKRESNVGPDGGSFQGAAHIEAYAVGSVVIPTMTYSGTTTLSSDPTTPHVLIGQKLTATLNLNGLVLKSTDKSEWTVDEGNPFTAYDPQTLPVSPTPWTSPSASASTDIHFAGMGNQSQFFPTIKCTVTLASPPISLTITGPKLDVDSPTSKFDPIVTGHGEIVSGLLQLYGLLNPDTGLMDGIEFPAKTTLSPTYPQSGSWGFCQLDALSYSLIMSNGYSNFDY